ncbi:MAG: dihydrofolate reductase [Bacteroidota bacterium]
MHKSIIVAAATNGTIGRDNQLPWHLPRDLQHFRQLTMGHHVIVGRKTFESIGKPLPGRTIIVVTRNQHYRAEGCAVVYDLATALRVAAQAGETEVFVAGGGSIYQEALAWADKIYLTAVQADVEGDIFFPTWDIADWIEVRRSHHPADDKHAYAYDFVELIKAAS